MKALGLIVVAWGIATSQGACVSDPRTDPSVDPMGTWTMYTRWTTTGCGILTTSRQEVIVASDERDGYTLAMGADNAGELVAGDVTATAELATLDVIVSDGGGTGTAHITATSDGAGDDIIGNGALTLTVPTACSQAFFVTGTLEP